MHTYLVAVASVAACMIAWPATAGPLSPQAGAAAVHIDETLRLHFDSAPALGSSGAVRIFRQSDDALVDTLQLAGDIDQLGYAGMAQPRALNNTPVRIEGDSAVIRPHSGKLNYGTQYYVVIDDGVLRNATLDGKPFHGIDKAASWRFTTIAAQPEGNEVTVDDDGPADFRSVQGALNYVMHNIPRDAAATIHVKNGHYHEMLFLRGKNNLTIQGESRDGVVIEYDNADGRNPGVGLSGAPVAGQAKGGRSLFMIEDADLLTLDTLTLHNTHLKSGQGDQAEAIYFNSSERLVARHVNLISRQDTLLVNGYSWFYDCLIAGDVDFIWGYAHTALFENSEIRTVSDNTNASKGGYVLQARSRQIGDRGYIFLNSRLTRQAGVPDGHTTLARSSGRAELFDQVSFINTEMGPHIAAAGWHDKPLPTPAVATAAAGWREYHSRTPAGTPLDLSARLPGGYAYQLTDDDYRARFASRAQIFADYHGAGWNPQPDAAADAWVPALGNGEYQNPVIHADYSDPDVIRVGDTYYMTSSSFNSTPGLPLLQSPDMVNWELVGHALPQQIPADVYAKPQHGKGVWAPCLRYHDGKFWIFYPDPDFGIYVITATQFTGPWSAPHLLLAGKGIIDPAPLWDSDGKAYLLHAWAKSRAGINNMLTLRQMAPDASRMLDDAGPVIVDGNQLPNYRTLEGPKFYQHNGYYYVFAPAGGVETGWQAVFRSRHVNGPYEDRIVMAQGSSSINGPHQGAWVQTPDGSDWFLHFQDQRAYGRVVHLQPMRWQDDWPVIGESSRDSKVGQPVLRHRVPVAATFKVQVPPTSDEFSQPVLGLQWQWNANWLSNWYSLSAHPGYLRLYTQYDAALGATRNLWDTPAILLQKLPAEQFTVNTRLHLQGTADGERAGLILYGLNYAWLGLRRQHGQLQLVYVICTKAEAHCQEQTVASVDTAPADVALRMTMAAGGVANFSYSLDQQHFIAIGTPFVATMGRWVGAQMGLFSVGDHPASAAAQSYVDVDYFRVTP